MTQYSSFFNAVETASGTFDRVYNASQWADYFSSFVGTGVFQGDNNTSLQVQAGENLNIIIAAGKAFINGYYYKNDSPLTFTLSQANANYSRIDNICIELNLNNREITAVVVTGDPSPTPTGPQLIQNGLIYQLCIGQVLVQPLTTTITSQNITDTRANTALCGWVTGIVDSISLQDVTNHLENWFTEVQRLQRQTVANTTAIETLNTTTVYTTVIPANSDLNTYTSTGLFSCSGSSDVASFQNAPNVHAGYLNVLAVGQNYAYQTWTDILQNKYVRSYAFYNKTWSVWEKLNNTDIGGINLFEGKTHNGEWGTKSNSSQFCITPVNLSGGISYTLSVNASVTDQAVNNSQHLMCYLVNQANKNEIYTIEFTGSNTVTKRITFVPKGGNYNFYGSIYPQKSNNESGIINWYNLQQGKTGTNWIPSLWDIKQMVNDSNIPLSQLSVIAPQVCKLSLDNNNLKEQNKALGEQVSKLTLSNQQHTEQIKMLGMQLVENKLKK